VDVDDYARVVVRLAHLMMTERIAERRALHVGYRRPLALAEIRAELAKHEPLSARFRVPVASGALRFWRRLAGDGGLLTRLELGEWFAGD
jgi:hypothetical protein